MLQQPKEERHLQKGRQPRQKGRRLLQRKVKNKHLQKERKEKLHLLLRVANQPRVNSRQWMVARERQPRKGKVRLQRGHLLMVKHLLLKERLERSLKAKVNIRTEGLQHFEFKVFIECDVFLLVLGDAAEGANTEAEVVPGEEGGIPPIEEVPLFILIETKQPNTQMWK